MRKEVLFCCLASLLALALFASPGCIEGGLKGGGAGETEPPLSFSRVPSDLEVKKMQVDTRGVLWVLTYGKEMYTLDPDLYLSGLAACGGDVEDFAFAGNGDREDPAIGHVYLASGQEGLLRMDRAGNRTPAFEGDIMVSVYADRSGGVYAGGAKGLYALQSDAWEKLWDSAGDPPGMPVKMARAPEGLLCEIWENRLELLVSGEAEGLPMQVPGEKNVRVVELLGMLSGEVFLVTTQGVYRLEGREFVMVRRSDDPIICASRIGAGDILLGKNSGALTRLSPATGDEEGLGSLDEPVEHVGSSTEEVVYAQGATGIYFSRDLVRAPARLVAGARYGVDAGLERPAGIRLSLPVSDYLTPEWFYFKVRNDAGGLSWELEHQGLNELSLDLQVSSDRVDVEVLAAAPSTDDFSFNPGDLFPFPEAFPEEAQPYLLPMAGVPADMPEIEAVLEGIPAEARQDMLALLLGLTRNGLFYHTACASRSLPPGFADGSQSEEYVREAVVRVLSGEGGDDYARALAFTALCRGTGIPARTALSFDNYLNQVYLYGVGWVPVDVSRPVFDFLAPSYPAVGSLPGAEGSFISGTGGVDDGLSYAELYRPEDESGASGPAGAATLIFCQPSSFRLRDASEAIPLPDGSSFYFEEKGGEVLLVRDSAGRREETPIYQDYDSFPLAEDLEVALRLVEKRYVVIEVSREL